MARRRDGRTPSTNTGVVAGSSRVGWAAPSVGSTPTGTAGRGDQMTIVDHMSIVDQMTVVMERPARYTRVERGEMPPVRRFALMVDHAPDAAQLRELAPAPLVSWDQGFGGARLWLDWP